MATDAQIQSLIGTGPPEHLEKLSLFRWGKKNPPKDPEISFASKTVLVTGSNTGLGYGAALKFAALGASKLILAVRTPAKGEEAKQKIVAATNCESANILVMQLDMSNYDSIRTFAKNLRTKVDTLDVALLNAGIAPPKYVTNPATGWESALQTNVISTALVAIFIMPQLKETAAKTGRPSQLTLTSSLGHKYVAAKDVQTAPGESLLKKLSSPEYFDPEKCYGVIKLMTEYVKVGLVDDYSKDAKGQVDVTINSTCPGYCTTDLGRDFPWYIAVPTKLMQMYYGRSAEEGSRSLVSATLLGKVGHSKFWTNDVLLE
jgi:NAD(P)-dependent dehydrogenase (short-subunit alcohol dehydrogenase family)